MALDFFENTEKVIEVFISKDKSINYKQFDIIEDIKGNSWIVYNFNEEENNIKVLRFPILKSKDLNIVVTLDLNDVNVCSKISKIFRS